MEQLDKCDIVVDVGGKYDSTKYFDHHQRGFSEVFGHGYTTKLSSAGLIFKHFGDQIISNSLGIPTQDPVVSLLYQNLYGEYIEGIDANDNGINAFDSTVPAQPKFKQSMSLPSMVSHLNPAWNDEEHASDEERDKKFLLAMELMGSHFEDRLQYLYKAWLPARTVIESALKEPLFGGKVVVLKTFAPWKDHLFALEDELKIQGRTLYVLYPDTTGQYRIQAVPVSEDSFESRRGLPESWRGLRDDILSTECGIDGCVFIHASGFIGGNKTKEGAIEMARKAVE